MICKKKIGKEQEKKEKEAEMQRKKELDRFQLIWTCSNEKKSRSRTTEKKEEEEASLSDLTFSGHA